MANDQSPQKLPPRSEVHKEKRKKTKFRIKYPLIRLLALFFVLLPVSILGILNYLGNQEDIKAVFSSHSQKNYEEINYAEKEIPKIITLPSEEKEKEIVNEEPKESNVETIENKSETIKIKENSDSVNENSGDNYELKYHTVMPNENLYRISMKYYHSRDGEQLLKEWNKLSGSEIIEGQVLVIPIKMKNTK